MVDYCCARVWWCLRFACLVCGCLRSVCISGLWLVLLASRLWLVIGLEVGALCVAICCLFVLAGCVLFLCLSLVIWLLLWVVWLVQGYVGSCWFIFCLIYLDVYLLVVVLVRWLLWLILVGCCCGLFGLVWFICWWFVLWVAGCLWLIDWMVDLLC